MINQRPYTPIFVTDWHQPLPQYHLPPGEHAIALQMDAVTVADTSPLPAWLIAGDIPFMLLIKMANRQHLLQSPLADAIKLCFFSKNYIRHNDVPVIAFSVENDMGNPHDYEVLLQPLLQTLQLQGWNTLHAIWVGTNMRGGIQLPEFHNSALFIESIDFDEAMLLRDFFSNPDRLGQYIFFGAADEAATMQLEEDFYRLCISAVNKEPFLGKYLQKFLTAKNEAAALANENRVLQERLGNAQHTIEIIRTKYKDDYDILFNWYQQEYEALPLWYKRVGQVIKAATGKRTFKSLFSNEPRA